MAKRKWSTEEKKKPTKVSSKRRPRFSLNVIRIFAGSFCGSVLYSNPHYVSPNLVRRAALQLKSGKFANRVEAKMKTDVKKKNRTETYSVDVLDDVFE